jgi:hypothetical protein
VLECARASREYDSGGIGATTSEAPGSHAIYVSNPAAVAVVITHAAVTVRAVTVASPSNRRPAIDLRGAMARG